MNTAKRLFLIFALALAGLGVAHTGKTLRGDSPKAVIACQKPEPAAEWIRIGGGENEVMYLLPDDEIISIIFYAEDADAQWL